MQKRIVISLTAAAIAGATAWALLSPKAAAPETRAVASAAPAPSPPTVAPVPSPTPAPVAAPDPEPVQTAPAPAPPPVPVAEARPPAVPDRSARPAADPPAREPIDLTAHRQTLLRPGSQGPAVAALQSELIRKHGYPLSVTGEFDEPTERVVREFQAHMGLNVDGLVGPATWSALINHFVELEWSGEGFYRYVVYESDSSWGTEQTVATIKRVAAQWAQRGHDVRIGVNDISLPHGGEFWPHSSHRTGRDVDLRTVRNDGQEAGGTWMDASYSRALTQELVDLLWATGEVETILFNDPEIKGVTPWPGHDDHLHVRFRR